CSGYIANIRPARYFEIVVKRKCRVKDIANEVFQNQLQEKCLDRQFFRFVDRSVKERVELRPLKMDAQSVEFVGMFNDAGDLALINMNVLNESLILFFIRNFFSSQFCEITDVNVNVCSVDFPTTSLC